MAAKVLANCMISTLRKDTISEAHAHRPAAAATYVIAEMPRPSSAHHQLAVRSSLKKAGTVLMNG